MRALRLVSKWTLIFLNISKTRKLFLKSDIILLIVENMLNHIMQALRVIKKAKLAPLQKNMTKRI